MPVEDLLFFNEFMYLFFGCVGSLLLHAGFLQLQRAGATLCCGVLVSHCGGFSCCGAWALGTQASVVVARGLQQLWLAGSRAQAQQLWRTGLVALRHVGSSWARARTCVPCFGRQILNHCATREALWRILYVRISCSSPNSSRPLLCMSAECWVQGFLPFNQQITLYERRVWNVGVGFLLVCLFVLPQNGVFQVSCVAPSSVS